MAHRTFFDLLLAYLPHERKLPYGDIVLTDHEILTLRHMAPLIESIDYTKPWDETLTFAWILIAANDTARKARGTRPNE